MNKKIYRIALSIIILTISTVICTEHLYEQGRTNKYKSLEIDDEYFRDKFYSEEMLLIKENLSAECKTILNAVEKEANYSPIPESTVDKSLKTSYINSWMCERSFGGKRKHEGVDIMATEDKRGLYPVLSITDGVVTNLGWLEKGGYRVGITSDSGTYYYYAHLDSFGNLKEGSRVKAGMLLGYMGDSGYGPEGTKGKFDVHLHLGIYVYKDGKEISLNPYYLLCSLENKKLKYAYS